MLPRDLRLRSNREFREVYRSGKAWAHPLLVLHVLPREGARRAGITVGRKTGGSVTRNRVRRRLREILRLELPAWRMGFDAVLVARADAAQAEFTALTDSVRQLARRARLPREPGEPPDTPYQLPAGGRARGQGVANGRRGASTKLGRGRLTRPVDAAG